MGVLMQKIAPTEQELKKAAVELKGALGPSLRIRGLSGSCGWGGGLSGIRGGDARSAQLYEHEDSWGWDSDLL